VLQGNLSVVFYDMNTLYFEAIDDDLRKTGFSMKGKHKNPEISRPHYQHKIDQEANH